MSSDLFETDIRYTVSAEETRELAKDAAASNFDIIVAVGGDGTVNEVASCMVGRRSILGIIPMGSGNGLARELNIPSDPAQTLDMIIKGRT